MRPAVLYPRVQCDVDAGVGKGSLSEIENGTRNPTLSTLYSLAGALGVPLATLLADRPGATVASPGIEARLLDVSLDDGHVVEVYRLRLHPGTTHRSGAHGPGESATWVSDVPHTYTAAGPATVESVLVIRS
jgi:DNA-binding XRE family transcriptional regulator